MKLSVLCRILETVSLGLDIFGRVADLTVIDAIAVGAFGANAVLMHSISSVEVCLSSSLTVTAANAKVTFGFSGGARQRQDCDMVVGEKRRGVAGALLRPRNDGCGAHCHLQVHSPTKVGPPCFFLLSSESLRQCMIRILYLYRFISRRFTEISYLCSIRDVLGQWGIQLKSSYCQQLLWFPFSELTVMTHLNPTEKYSMVSRNEAGPPTRERESSFLPSFPILLQSKQPVLNYFLERLGDVCSRALRRLSLLTSQSLPPLLCSILSRVQFFAQWGVAKNRSDFVHSLPRMWAPQESCRGTSWLVPAEKVPEVRE